MFQNQESCSPLSPLWKANVHRVVILTRDTPLIFLSAPSLFNVEQLVSRGCEVAQWKEPGLVTQSHHSHHSHYSHYYHHCIASQT